MPPPDSPSSFYADELLRALTEQSFGIETFSVLTTTPIQAVASVTLLEGHNLTIKLTTRGYSIESSDCPALRNRDDLVFESLDGLLQSTSILYGQKQHAALVKNLERFL